MKFLKLLLFPFSMVYGLIIWTRNRLFDFQILKSKSYDIPTIVVGNLAIGGTGKSPMTEFIIKLLKDKFKVATLSRGYGRETKGFRLVQTSSTANEVGDEPLQFKNKFPDITVSVCEDRCNGIENLMSTHEVIILDDAFQHRRLNPKFSILLFDYSSCLNPMFVLPMGNFRDLPAERKRADLILVTKTPNNATEREKEYIRSKLIRKSNVQDIIFTTIAYGQLITINGASLQISSHTDILLLTGIANPLPLIQHLKSRVNSIEHLAFRDHHAFDENDIKNIKEKFETIASDQKIILTTEKDAQRIRTPEFLKIFNTIPIAYLPIEIAFEHERIQHSVQDKLLSTCVRSVNES
ncbi:tetraacyldisaccharide 4'-kinase [Sphingobacterium sp. SRCM116780]|uniref:tetraacyldisaccharide 4'-kinase n=1 Tax=Sphingobacterium sp. SRCM116780 TaxID=2907623 RepID=UPI001F404ABA|nr:tetraacyldisaccharide 4'-kinase [Sphingobacterium sp. SRCM116780]UIR55739.1 tetraacyldisaccharide 4'-kinase [Sphingobacterium sp. SRCM116780]